MTYALVGVVSLAVGLALGVLATRSTSVAPPPAGGSAAGVGTVGLETLPCAALQVDGAGSIAWTTRMAERLVGRGSLVGVPVTDLVPQWADLATDTAERLVSARGADLGERWTVEIRVGKGASTNIELQRVATDDGWWVVLRDHASHHAALERATRANANLTEARDKALASSKAKTATLGRVAQSLRTPLTAIAGYGDLLVEELGERGLDDLVGDARRIRAATDALEAVLQTLIDWSEIEAGRMEVTTTEFDLVGLLGDLAEGWGEGGVPRELVRDVEPGLRAVANPERVGQIVGHLLRNARQHGGSGPVTLKARRWDQSIGITVRDQWAARRCVDETAVRSAFTARIAGPTVAMFATRAVRSTTVSPPSNASPPPSGPPEDARSVASWTTRVGPFTVPTPPPRALAVFSQIRPPAIDRTVCPP